MEIIRVLVCLSHLFSCFKIDVIVWKSCFYTSSQPPTTTCFKIDVIVWKCGHSHGLVAVHLGFKIDVIVWKFPSKTTTTSTQASALK